MEIDQRELRRVLGHFATGVTVVTVRSGPTLHGMTANAFSSVSLDPPLVLVCVDKRADTHHLIAGAGCFAVNILGKGQKHLSDRFARKDLATHDQFQDLAHREEITGSPVLEGCLAFMDCRLVASHDAGDHTIYIGQVMAMGSGGEALPLVFYQGRYGSVDLS